MKRWRSRGEGGHLDLEGVVLLRAELSDAEHPDLPPLPGPHHPRQLARVAGGEHLGHLPGES